MNIQQIQMLLTGAVWGAWPIVLKESGLKGNLGSAAFSIVVLAIVTPFALRSAGGSLPAANWILVLIAGLLGATGMLMFNDGLATAAREKTGDLFLTMMIVQMAIPAIYQIFQDGKITKDRAIGFSATFVAVYYLTR